VRCDGAPTFFLNCAADLDDGQCTFYAQVGQGAEEHCSGDGPQACKHDHGYWGRPEDYYRDHPYASQRQTFAIDASHPGTEIWAGASAALAAAAVLLRDTYAGYASKLLAISRRLYKCARKHNRDNALLQEALPEVYPQYPSYGLGDELGWASAWLLHATRERAYADHFRENMERGEDLWWYEGYGASWDDVNALAKLRMLLTLPSYEYAMHLTQQVRTYLSKWQQCNVSEPQATACGLCFLHKWSPLRYSLTTSLMAAIYQRNFDGPEGRLFGEWAEQQLRYALGDNPQHMSYMVGASAGGRLRFPRRPHHRASSCVPPDEGGCSEAESLCSQCDNPWVLYGAMVGGPDSSDCWDDDRTNWERNEVALDYNAPLPGLLAWRLSSPDLGHSSTELEAVAKITHTEYRQADSECKESPQSFYFASICTSKYASNKTPPCPYIRSPCLPDLPHSPTLTFYTATPPTPPYPSSSSDWNTVPNVLVANVLVAMAAICFIALFLLGVAYSCKRRCRRAAAARAGHPEQKSANSIQLVDG